MTQRPDFNPNLSSEEFLSYYWYKTELESICRNYSLPSYGTKAELTAYIQQFLQGKPANQIKRLRRTKPAEGLKADQISPETKLLDSGFKLDKEARQFFASYYGQEKFTFKKAMAIKLREVERLEDKEATVADLIAVLENPDLVSQETPEEKSYQWNRFVKDFRQAPLSQDYSEPMKVAALLWQKVKNSQDEKVYTSQLLADNQDELSRYLK